MQQQFQFDDKFFRDRGNDYFRRDDFHPALLLYSFCVGLIDKTTKDKTAKAKVLCNRAACWRKLSAMHSAFEDALNALKCDKKYWRSYHWLAQIHKDIGLFDYAPRVIVACFANCEFPRDEFSASSAVEMYMDYLETAAPAGYSSQLRKNGTAVESANGPSNGGIQQLGLSSASWNCLLAELKRQQRRPQLAFTLAELRRQTGPSIELAAPFSDPAYLIDLAGGAAPSRCASLNLSKLLKIFKGGGGWNASMFDQVWPSLTPDRVTEPAFRARVAESLTRLALTLAPHTQVLKLWVFREGCD
uniref:TPR_REGION domain-containing protein n=1 Tax=Macrostomum lignano TaxID=282301 RepID=A0A1I8IKI4_9PLAT